MTFVVALLRVAALAYGGYMLLLFVLQRSLVYQGTQRIPPGVTSGAPDGAERLLLDLGGEEVEAWLLRADAGGAGTPTAVFGHGNGELVDDWLRPMDAVRARGVNVVLVEFPGYGRSGGRPRRSTIRETFATAYDRVVRDPGVDPERIVAWGRSLGGGAAADLALDRPVAALVLQSTFSSAADVAWHDMRAPGFLVRDRFDPAAAVRAFDGPVLLLHGRADRVIPFHHARRLAAARPGLEVTEIPCGHNDCLAAWPEIVDRVAAFLEGEGLLGRTDGSGRRAPASPDS